MDEVGFFDSAMGPFTTWPADAIQQDFRQHVLLTGRPDTWEHHYASKPPADEEYHEVLSFEVPEKKRAEVGMATCPICSPGAPKYYAGALAWFPKQGRLRAIGNECARSHFGDGAVARARMERQRRLAEHYLLDELPKATTLQQRAARLESPAAAMDDLRSALFRAASKTGWQRIAKLGADGLLPIEQMAETNIVDSFGASATRQVSRVVETIDVEGVSFLTEQYSSLSEARNAISVASRVAVCTPDEAIDLVVSISDKLEDLLDAEKLLRAALAAVAQLERKVESAKAFVTPENLERLNRWTHDDRVDVGVVVSYSHSSAYQFKVRAPGKAWQTLPVPGPLQSAPRSCSLRGRQ